MPPQTVVRQTLKAALDPDERALLDRLAAETGLSRAEVLRRGLNRFAIEQSAGRSPMLEFMEWMNRQDSDLPSDLAARHDDYLAETYEAEVGRRPSPPRS